jgi:hypothetical protein
MTFLAFLNELSYPTGRLSQGEARQAARTLIGLLKELRAERADLALHSSVSLGDVPLGEDLWLSSLRADGESVDEWRFLRGLENRAPFHIGLDRRIDGLVDYEFENRRALGLGLAYDFDALAVSFDSDPWRYVNVSVDRIELSDGGIFEREQVTARNASIRDHVEDHRAWVRLIPLIEPNDGNDLWESRGMRFPRLKFLPQVEAQIRSLKSGTPELFAVNRRLWEIQSAAGEWDVATDALPTFRSKTTPEHQNRRDMFNFADIDGQIRCFDLHVRYTPGAGRVHMWCDRTSSTVSIGYVGLKVQ